MVPTLMPLVDYMSERGTVLIAALALFTALGYGVGRLPNWRRAGFGVDLAYYIAQPLFTRIAAFVGLLALVALQWGGDTGAMNAAIARDRGSIAAWSAWVQGVVVFLLWELVIYWQHRLLHRRVLWPLHAVHHSSAELDWLSTYRMHPLEVMFYLASLPVWLAMGFSLQAFLWTSTFRLFHNAFVHADLPWTLGPLGWVITSPVLHRWHHEKSSTAGKNFASAFAFYDVIFGTYYCPAGTWPRSLGVHERVPETFWAQLAYPFRSKREDARA